ncbi:MAG TPA: hypothetical protein VGE74_29940 [Gemmata sp.]
MTMQDWYAKLEPVVSKSEAVDVAGVLVDICAFLAAEPGTCTDKVLQERIRGLRELLLARRQQRAAVKYRKQHRAT